MMLTSNTLVLNACVPPVITRHRRIARRNDEATRLPAEGMVSDRSRPAFEAGSPQTAVRRTRTTPGKRDPETCRDRPANWKGIGSIGDFEQAGS